MKGVIAACTWLLCALFVLVTVAESHQLNGEIEKHPFKALNTEPLSTKRVPNEFHCSMNCQRHDNCKSFNFAATNDSVGNFICEMLGSRWSELPSQKFMVNESFHHFSFKDFCTPNAKSPPLLKRDNTYECECKHGFTGMKCEFDINECSSNPCVHGTCNDKINAYTCSCDPGYTGKNCETDIDECASHPCVNGTCQNLIARYQCDCVPGYTGTNCDTDIDECASKPCKNEGTCVDGVNGYRCSCKAGYTGSTCETAEIFACESNPCKNGGSCENLPAGDFKCTCNNGQFGPTCQNLYVIVSNPDDRDDAKDDCNDQGKLLGTITDQATNDLFKSKFSADFWIGYRKGSTSGVFGWQGGAVSSYTNWESGQPGTYSRFVSVNHVTGKWSTTNPYERKPYVCTKLN